MSIIELKNVNYAYNTKYQRVHAVRDVSCAFDKGKVYALVGKSGSGKTTLLSLIAGLDTPHGGEILYEGKPISGMDLNEYRRSRAAVIYQDFKLFPLLTVIENIMYPMELCGIKAEDAKKSAEELAKKVALPESLLHRFPGMISGGEQQRVSIARALSMDRKLILADEPTGNLDSENGNNIVGILVKLAHEENCCVIIATHDLNILDKTDEIFYITDGEIKGQSQN